MSSRTERRKHAGAFIAQAEADLKVAASLLEDARIDQKFFAAVTAYAQQGAEKAIKAVLIWEGVSFEFTHQILRWTKEHPRVSTAVLALLRKHLSQSILREAMELERLAPSLDEQGRDVRFPYLLAGRNTEYPYAEQGKVLVPAEQFERAQAERAVRTAGVIVKRLRAAPFWI